MSEIKIEVIKNVVNIHGDRLFIPLCTFPRIILSEVNTHRMFSRSSASSRAIPAKKMVKSVEENTFIPIAFQKQHSGMQGSEYLTLGELEEAVALWLDAADDAVKNSNNLIEGNITKQISNRVLEAFMYHTALVASTDDGWENFFELRCPQYNVENVDSASGIYRSRKAAAKACNELYEENLSYEEMMDDEAWRSINKGKAEIHIMALAELLYDAYQEKPTLVNSGEWVVPYDDKMDEVKVAELNCYDREQTIGNYTQEQTRIKLKLSTSMAARTSYTVVGDEKEITYKRLSEIHDEIANARPIHASPFEYCNRAMTTKEYLMYSRSYVTCYLTDKVLADVETHKTFIEGIGNGQYKVTEYGYCRNLRGYIQYRHILENKLPIIP
jgi:thymidylate synthase ThyX